MLNAVGSSQRGEAHGRCATAVSIAHCHREADGSSGEIRNRGGASRVYLAVKAGEGTGQPGRRIERVVVEREVVCRRRSSRQKCRAGSEKLPWSGLHLIDALLHQSQREGSQSRARRPPVYLRHRRHGGRNQDR